jgi:outer membrane protein assembly factor BamB
MQVNEFVTALEQRGVVAGDLGSRLRAKAAGDPRVTPDAILKYLVKKNVITAQQAEVLELSLLSVPDAGESEILDLMPLPEEAEPDDSEDLAAWSLDPVPTVPPLAPPAPPRGSQPPAAAAAPPRRGVTDDDQLFGGPDAPLIDAQSLESGIERAATGVYRLGGSKKKTKRTAGGKNQWDSPLMLVGGGALALLVVAGAALYFLLFRETADAVLKDAQNLVKSGAYAQAITRYEDFVDRFSNHSEASLAKVELEMTRLWQAVEGGGDPAGALKVAQETISAIEDQPAFISSSGDEEAGVSEAKRDLSTLLVRIGRKLVEAAEETNDPAEAQSRVEQIETVLALCDNDKYVPENLRNEPELASIRESLTVIASRQQREGDLKSTLEKMDAAIAAGDTAAAYAARLTLLASYPALADDESLAAKVNGASAAEQKAVQFIAGGDAKPEAAWPARAVVAEIALAARSESAAEAAGPPVVVRIDGALYGLRSGDGAMLWRRFAGPGETTPPLVLEDGGVAAADLRGGELWRLDAATGKLVWRLPLGEKLAGVVAAGPRLLAAGESGKLFVVDAGDGALVGHVDFGQPTRSAPVVNERGNRIYVVGESSIIYTLSGDDYSCLGVYYIGHDAGGIVAPPVAVLDKVIVADNSGDDTCRIRALSIDDKGVIAGETATDRLSGRVVTPLSIAARRLAVATTSGQLAVYDVSGAGDQSSLTIVARREGQDRDQAARYTLLHDGSLWVASRQLMKLAILPTENQLSVTSLESEYQRDAFQATPLAVGKLVIHVRRPAGRAGAVVAAMDSTSNRSAWATELAVPVAGAPAAVGAAALAAVTASGASYALDRQALVRGVQDKAERATAAPTIPLSESVDLGGGRIVAGSIGGAALVLFQPGDASLPVRVVSLAGPLSCAPVAWRGGFVAATVVGQVFLFDGETGESLAAAFQPELAPDRQYKWLAPATTGDDDASQLVLSDGAEQLHLIELAPEPAPHLQAVKTVDVGASPLVTPLAVAANTVFAGTEDGAIARFELPELKAAEPLDVGARVAWGPFAVGDAVILATESGDLMRIGPAGEPQWRRPLEHGALAGKPLIDGDSVLALHSAGGVSRINLADGAETGYSDIGQSAIAGPIALGERLVVAASDGALLVVNRP